MRKTTVLVASPPALASLIRHLFADQLQFEVIGNADGLRRLANMARRLAPQLILASVDPVKTSISEMTRRVKRSSPRSKLILICPVSDLVAAGQRNGAEACLDLENLVFDLLPTASQLAQPSKPVRTPG